MIVYGETNFICEVAYEQDHASTCDEIIGLAEKKKIKLIFPAFSALEVLHQLIKRTDGRFDTIEKIWREIGEVARTKLHRTLRATSKPTVDSLRRSIEDDRRAVKQALARLEKAAEFVDLNFPIAALAHDYERNLKLKAGDAAVLSSVVTHSKAHTKEPRLFVTSDKRDFGVNPDIRETLLKAGCDLTFSFPDALIQTKKRLGLRIL